MRKFGRKKANREHMLRNLTTSVILYESVATTESKAKDTQMIVEKIINLAKTNSLSAKRRLLAYLTHKNATKKIYEVLIDRFKDKNSGYVKIYKYGYRKGDGAPKAIIKLVGAKLEKKEKPLDKMEEKAEVKNTKKAVTTTVKNKS